MEERTLSHYQIVDKLGEGGMGVVYKARDLRLDRFVALKCIAPHLLDSPHSRRRFDDEARALSSLNHPHIETIYEAIEEGGAPVLVMEYLPGGTLRDRQVAIAELVAHALQIADGLGYAHRRGIIHRDLKPENILFTEDGAPKISDFGLARLRHAADVTRTEATAGTLHYLAPECVQGTAPDTRADIFSFGIMLYEMVAGVPPFGAEHAAVVLYNIVHRQAPCLSRNLPDTLRRVIARAMEKDRERRYQSMEELAGELRSQAVPREPEPEPETWQTILVAEDEDDLREAVRISLSAEGYRVLPVRNGREAVRTALDQRPDLVLLDVTMPGINGLDACQELRQRGFRGPIAMLTGKAEEIDRVLGLEMGADDYVTKPFSARELLSRVRAHLRRERRAAAS